MKKKAKISIFLVLLVILGLTYYYQEEIVVFILNNFLIKKETSTLKNNDYLISNNYLYLLNGKVYDYHTDKLFIVVLNIFFYSRHIDSIGALR